MLKLIKNYYFNEVIIYLKIMKYLFILCFLPSLSFAEIEITKEVDFELDLSHDEMFVVEKAYEHLFDKEVFNKEVKEVLSIIEKNKSVKKIKIDINKYSQSIFIERYLKKEKYDAYIYDEKTLIVYSK
jgi:hypothetical protein